MIQSFGSHLQNNGTGLMCSAHLQMRINSQHGSVLLSTPQKLFWYQLLRLPTLLPSRKVGGYVLIQASN